MRGVVAKQAVESAEQALAFALQTTSMAGASSELELIVQALRAKKAHPVIRTGVDLGRRADGVVAVPAEEGSLQAVHLRQTPSEGRLRRAVAVTAEGQVFEDQISARVRHAVTHGTGNADGLRIRHLP